MQKEFEKMWRNKWLTWSARSLDDMIELLRAAADELAEMNEAGVTLDLHSDIMGDYATLITTDANVAEEYGFDRVESHPWFGQVAF